MKAARLLVLIAVLVIATPSFCQPVDPCSTTLGDIQSAILEAANQRASCEANFFTGPPCIAYWQIQARVVGYQIDYQDCLQSSNQAWMSYVAGDGSGDSGEVDNQGNITRAALNAVPIVLINATVTATNNSFDEVVSAAAETRSVISASLSTAQAAVQANISAEFQATSADSAAGFSSAEGVSLEQFDVSQNVLSSNFQALEGTIASNFASAESTVAALNSSDSSLFSLFLKIAIESTLLADNNNGRVDLFQRPAALGGYYEVMKSVVTDAVSYNEAQYHFSSSASYSISSYLNSAQSYENNRDYRSAWEEYRNAYLAVTCP